MSSLRAAAASDTGYLRTINQDLAVASSDLAAIADGMGGHLGGEVAASVAVETLVRSYRERRSTEGLIEAVRSANDAVYRRAKSDRSLRGMGTTLTAAALVADEPGGPARIALVNVGDSRAYFVDVEQRRLHQLTEDHSVVEEMVRNGEITSDEAAVHPHRHILTRALGIEADIHPDVWELDLDPGSRLLLCSDGLTNEVDDLSIAAVLVDELDPVVAASHLVALALQKGGTDNVTVVVVDLVEAPGDDSLVVLPEAAAFSSGDQPAQRDEGADVTQAIELAAVAAEAGAASPPITAVPPPASPPITAVPPPASPPPAPAEQPAPGAGSALAAAPLAATPLAATPLAMAPRVLLDGPPTRSVVLVPRTERPKMPKDRIITFRVVLFVLLFAAVLGGTAGVVLWFDKASFFVGLNQGRVTIFQGRPGGLLWFKPSVVERTSITSADLLPSSISYLQAGMEESSYSGARNLVRSLAAERSTVVVQPSSAVVTTTTTRPVTVATTPATTIPVTSTTIVPTTTTSVPPTTTTSTTSTTAPKPTTTQPKKGG